MADRTAEDDWDDYVRGDKLNRTEIAKECEFALSALRQNPTIRSALETLEARLRSEGVIKNRIVPTSASEQAEAASVGAVNLRIVIAKAKSEARVKELEEKVASLQAEVRQLRQRVAYFQHIDDHLGGTGRLLPP
jgi:hypothetical protein